MNTESFILNFAKLKDVADAFPSSYDYQKELVEVWSIHLKSDLSGILEGSINHSECSCCSRRLNEPSRGRKVVG